jgi:predicted YcjX-like family ATPase
MAIRVGLTGMSRSGKTVFLTSAIYHLTKCTGRGLTKIENSGWLYTGTPVPGKGDVESFPYKTNFEKLQEDPPGWPPPTERPAEYRVRLTLKKGRSARECEVVFVDYPGELLLDVSLLNTSYEEMSDDIWLKIEMLRTLRDKATILKQKADALKDFANAAKDAAELTEERLKELRQTAGAAGSTAEVTRRLDDLKLLARAGGAQVTEVAAIDGLSRLKDFAKETTPPGGQTPDRLKSLAESAQAAAKALDCVMLVGKDVGTRAQEFFDQVRGLRSDERDQVSANEKQVTQNAFDAFCDESRAAGIAIPPALPAMSREWDKSSHPGPYFPLDSDARKRLPGLSEEMLKKYVDYQEKTVRPAFREISRCSHQIVLVDVLGALRAGPRKCNELFEQMNLVMECYRELNTGFWDKVLKLVGLRENISKVSFCTTKADQATSDNRNNLTKLLEPLFERTVQGFDRRTKFGSYRIAAHRCTTDMDSDHEGKPMVALKGRLKDDPSVVKDNVFPGRVPKTWPRYPEDFQGLHFPDFVPRSLPLVLTGDPLPNIDMDLILHAILEDQLR